MRRHIITLGLVAALALAGCATTSSTAASEGKALTVAWASFGAASTTLDNLALAGSLTPSEKATVHSVEPQVQEALQAATDAYNGGNEASASENVARATSLLTTLVGIVAAHKGG